MTCIQSPKTNALIRKILLRYVLTLLLYACSPCKPGLAVTVSPLLTKKPMPLPSKQVISTSPYSSHIPHDLALSLPHPSFFTMLMSRRSTVVAVAGSMTCMTASTHMGASRLEYCDTTLEQREVVALLNSVSRSLSSTGVLMDSSTSTPLSTAFWKDSEIMVGWIPEREQGEREKDELSENTSNTF